MTESSGSTATRVQFDANSGDRLDHGLVLLIVPVYVTKTEFAVIARAVPMAMDPDVADPKGIDPNPPDPAPALGRYVQPSQLITSFA
jgi:hypothetical protein